MLLPIFKITIIRNKNFYITFLIWYIFTLNIHSQYVGGGRGDDYDDKNERAKLHPCAHTWLWLH